MQRSRRFVFSLGIVALTMAHGSVIAEPEGTGRVDCRILENGESASGTISLRKDGSEVRKESCNGVITVEIGTYSAVVSLDGVLNGAEQKHSLTVRKGSTARVVADFPTGFLEVHILSEGKKAAGMAIIRKDNGQIGTLGSGVSAHLSVGSYQVVARYRSQEKQFDNVIIEAAKKVVLNATFD
ncbi:MAG: hypothetical protein JXA30_15495 [Deltaproteobacteria bacterium]|nr:hypothetical protein [Deltaproteobacteria bacterium]